ncbi:Nitrogen assimilation transcription factor nit-4 [Verticillium dahliae VDG2]|nr:Nitrogen assimilation transcription factor nit-4 [Verticillium dahliae VDG2]
MLTTTLLSLQTSSRPRGDVGGSFASRRGHASQLSISDPSHHVTEAIGTLYGDEDDYANDHRPMSFIHQPEHLHKLSHLDDGQDPRRQQLLRSTSDQSGTNLSLNGTPGIKKAQTLPTRAPSLRSNAYGEVGKTPLSPTMSLRDVKNESSQFPLTNIEHPNDIAQELSNLQALRRMSMDVGNNTDPDLLPFSSMSLTTMPSMAPSGDDDEADPSRLLWVPAAVHPELAPTEFKNFLENRVQSMKRRSGESLLSPDTLDRSNSGGLRRKKSMLSRQIDNSGGRGADGYVDGSVKLDGKRTSEPATELSLDDLMKDPTGAVQKLAQESQPGVGPEGSVDDMPILPMVPGMGLRRSTRTTYRKGGSLRSGERHSLNKRTSASRQNQAEAQQQPEATTAAPLEDVPKGHLLSRVQSEPISENFSRPGRPARRQQNSPQEDAYSALTGGEQPSSETHDSTSDVRSFQDDAPARTSSTSSVPQIIEPSASEDDQGGQRQFPQRTTSTQQGAPDEPPARSSKRPGMVRSPQSSSGSLTLQQQQQQQQQQPKQQKQQQHGNNPNNSLNDMAHNPSPLPGGGATRTDSLTFIPTLAADDRKAERKSKKDKDDESSSVSTSKSWSKWLKGSGDDKEKKKRDEEKKKSKTFVEKAQDNVRLDVLQNSIESAVTKGRESLLLDRDNVDSKLAEERKKESSRKSDPAKKEKEGGGLFSGLFGGGKKKGEKESSSKKGHHLRVSEDPIYRPLRPDVDYHWTRFPLLEERAIYRMAHIKLANPRRSLSSQVLLSNFMYNYLAIVQAMHPQAQVPQSPQQRRLEEERRRKEQEEQYLAQQQLQQQQQEESDQDALDQYNFDYHRGASQYGDNNSHDGVDYVDDAQIYEYEHGGGGGGGQNQSQGNDNSYGDEYGGTHGKEYYDQYDQGSGANGDGRGRHSDGRGRHSDGRDDMW